MDDNLAQALLGQQQSAQQQSSALYDGATATNPQTGQRIIYRINPTGHGRWVALSADTAEPAARDRVGELTQRSQTGGRTLNLARQFVDLNTQAQTGGIQNDPNLPEWLRPPNAQRLSALSGQMVGANWVPGTSGMMNTATEQQLMRQRYPAPTNRGNVNRDVYFQMAEDVGVQQAAVEDMRAWLRTRPTLDGWDTHWAQVEARMRPQIRQRVQREFYEAHHQGGAQEQIGPAPQGVTEAEWRAMTPEDRALWSR